MLGAAILITEFYRDKTFNEDIFITTPDTNSNNLLSRNASVNLGIIKFIGDVPIADSLFGFGHRRTKPVKLALKNDSFPLAISSTYTENSISFMEAC